MHEVADPESHHGCVPGVCACLLTLSHICARMCKHCGLHTVADPEKHQSGFRKGRRKEEQLGRGWRWEHSKEAVVIEAG